MTRVTVNVRRRFKYFSDEGDMDMDAAESVAAQIFSEHSSLLSKGLALSSPPSVTQALDGTLPYR